MILDRIIEMELALLLKKRVPRRILINLANYNVLVKELEEDRYLEYVHNMKIEIVKSSQLVVV
jgi:hypothetical protein